MSIKLTNHFFEELKELPGFQENFRTIRFNLDNDLNVCYFFGADDKFEILYDVEKGTVEQLYPDSENNDRANRYFGTNAISVERTWVEEKKFWGLLEFYDASGKEVFTLCGDREPENLENYHDLFEEIIEIINPETMIDFVIDVIRCFYDYRDTPGGMAGTSMKLSNNYFEELKELPGYQKNFRTIRFNLDNDFNVGYLFGGNDKFEILYNVEKGTIEQLYPDLTNESEAVRYFGTNAISVERTWVEKNKFWGLLEFYDASGKEVFTLCGDREPENLENYHDLFEEIIEIINPETMIDFLIDVVRTFYENLDRCKLATFDVS